MTMVGMGLAAGPSSPLRFSQTRGRIQGSPVNGVNYPSPFFDVAHTYLPVTVKQMFRWCRYYFLTNPLINAVVFKMAEYPITDLIFEHESEKVVGDWTDYFQDHLRYRAFQIEVGLDYFCYGNAFISIGYPFHKYIRCSGCGWSEQASKCRNHWVFTNYTFRLACPKCSMTGEAVVNEMHIKNASGIKTIRWNPEDIEIVYNDLTGEYTYYYTIPAVIRNDIIIGRKEVVESVPQIFIQALKEQKGIIFSKDKLFHLRRPSLATQDRGWGLPLLLPVLKDTFYLQIMKKAQEAILLEHIVPLRVLFPQAASGTADPFTSINLVDWRDHVANEIARWRYDQNYIPIMPLPIGNQTIGGDGRALLMTSEIQQWSEQIINGMQVPIEFIKGGLSYAGTNVSMRMLENAFLGYVLRHKQLVRFVMQEIGSFMGWPKAKGRFRPFKMADDIQRKALLAQLNQQNKVSDTTLLNECDLSQSEENKLMIQETATRLEATKKQQLAMAQIQGESQLVMMKYQVKGQQVMAQAQQAGPSPGEPGGPDAAVAQGGGTPGGQSAAPPGQLPPGTQQGATQQGTPAGTAQPAQPGMEGQAPPAADAAAQQFEQTITSSLGSGNRMNGQMQVDMQSYAMAQAQSLATLDPVNQQLALQNLQAQSPQLADLVAQMLQQIMAEKGQQQPQQGGAIDMTPMPEQRPPRRAGMG